MPRRTKRSMLEKLTEDYDRTIKWGNGGHRIGYYREKNEMIYGRYEFPLGGYTIYLVSGRYFEWNYHITEAEKKRLFPKP